MIGKHFNRILNVFEILRHSNGGVEYFRHPSRSLASFNILDQLSRRIPRLGTVVDVGANQGQFACAVKRFFPQAVVHSFEPVPETFEKLSANTKQIAGIQVYNFGLGSVSGKIDFYQNEHSHASSALPISDFQKTELPETAKTRMITVPVKRLDDLGISVKEAEGSVLLKLDVQGYEKHVLLGATDFLKGVDYLLFEASFVSMYEGEPLFDEMHALVSEMGFRLLGPVGSLEVGASQIAQMDMLYVKK